MTENVELTEENREKFKFFLMRAWYGTGEKVTFELGDDVKVKAEHTGSDEVTIRVKVRRKSNEVSDRLSTTSDSLATVAATLRGVVWHVYKDDMEVVFELDRVFDETGKVEFISKINVRDSQIADENLS